MVRSKRRFTGGLYIQGLSCQCMSIIGQRSVHAVDDYTNCVGDFPQPASPSPTLHSSNHPDNLLSVAAKSATRVWKPFTRSRRTSATKISAGAFFVSAVKLWRLCAGHFRVRRVPRSPVFHTCVQLPPIMWK